MTETLKVALKAVEDKKAFDVVVLDISSIASFASYFLLCSGDSSRQIQAIEELDNLSMRVQEPTPRWAQLADAFNAMLGRLMIQSFWMFLKGWSRRGSASNDTV